MPTGAAIAGGAALGALGSSGSKKGSTTTTSEPWKVQAPFLGHIYQSGHDLFRAQHPGPFNAPMVSGDATDQIGKTIRGDYLNPASNPFLQSYVNDALGLVKSNFAGQYGGQAGSNLGNTGYQEMLTRTLANTALPIYANAYNSERQNQLNAAQLAPSVDTSNLTLPFAPLQAYSNLVQGMSPGGSVTQPFFTNPLAGAMGGALSGGILSKMMG